MTVFDAGQEKMSRLRGERGFFQEPGAEICQNASDFAWYQGQSAPSLLAEGG